MNVLYSFFYKKTTFIINFYKKTFVSLYFQALLLYNIRYDVRTSNKFLDLGGISMNSDRLSILERLENRSQNGNTTATLNLYRRQIGKLVDQGFSVEKISPVYGRVGQSHCQISWRNAEPDTVAYGLLMTAANNNAGLREELAQENFAPVRPPYSYL